MRKWLLFVIVIAVTSVYWGCGKMNQVLEPNESVSNISDDAAGLTSWHESNGRSHWEAEKVISYKRGGSLIVDKVFRLDVDPYSMSTQENTEIFCEVDGDTQEGKLFLQFHFEPEGLQFNPAAELILNWDKLEISDHESLNLLYWNPEANEWQKVSDWNDASNVYKWNRKGKRISFPIGHFSIYALSKD